MNREYDAIVVGGGIAGLTCAACLCRGGISTLLVEKSEKTGGLVNTFRHQGFAFDAGIRAFENSGILFPFLKSLGIDMEFVENPVSIGIGDKWVKLVSRDSLLDYASMLADFFPDNKEDIELITAEIKKVMSYMDVIYGIDNPLFLENMRDMAYITKTLLPWLLRYQINIRKAARLNQPVKTYLRRFTSNVSLIDMISQHFFKDTPAFFALSYFGLYLDYCYAVGGTGTLAQKITDYIRNSGGEILTETNVCHIDSGAHEIRLSGDDPLQYKKLIWAADQQALYASLNESGDAETENRRTLTEKSAGGDSVLSLFLGVSAEKSYFADRCGTHAFYTPNTEGLTPLSEWRGAAKSGADALLNWVGSYLERTTYEISCPALRDASLAPEGNTGIIASTLMDYGLVRYFSDSCRYETFKQYCADKITAVLKASLFPEIDGKIIFTLCATPMTIERETGNTQGAITGWAFTNDPIPAENRFRKIAGSIKTPIIDTFQCGQWSFSPAGMPVSILTGKLAADAVCKALKG